MLLPSRQREAAAPPPDAMLAEWVDRMLRYAPWPWHTTCLKRAAVLFYLLGKAGRPAMLSIGVRRTTDKALAAHAWLTRGESVILEPVAEDVSAFERIARFPESA
jgi:hypothetical protein